MSVRTARLRLVAALLPLLGTFFLGQAILDARAWRIDLTPDRRFTLSDHARHVLAELPAEVRVLAFLRAQDPRNLFVEDLLRQVAAHSDRVHVERLDVNRHPALARQYGVGSNVALVVESDGRRRVVSNPGEEMLVAGLLQVTRQQRKTVGWVVGHGEGDLHSTDRREGFSTARILLEQEYYEVRPVSLIGDEVPPEVAVLVVAGPDKGFLAEQLAALDRFLQRPGHVLFLLDPLRAPELAAFLERGYGLALPPDVVIDPEARLYGGEFLTMQVQFERGVHPVLGPLDAPPLFSLTRSVGLVTDADPEQLAGVPFLQTTAASWATTDTSVLRTGAPVFQRGRDRGGPVTVGLEVAFRALTPPGADARQGRMIVYGNSKFANNFFIEFLGNKDLFLNTVNWLAREPQAMTRRPRRQALGLQQFYVSNEQGRAIFWTTAVLQPALLAVVGVLLVWRRRRD